jgi:hypothetical protein
MVSLRTSSELSLRDSVFWETASLVALVLFLIIAPIVWTFVENAKINKDLLELGISPDDYSELDLGLDYDENIYTRQEQYNRYQNTQYEQYGGRL